MDPSVCGTWFDINKCDDDTCDTTKDTGLQTRCNLNSEAQSTETFPASSGVICAQNYEPGAPYGVHSTSVFLDAWKLCSWCCNWCNVTAAPGNEILQP